MAETLQTSDPLRIPPAPLDPSELRAELRDEAFWIVNASRFVTCAAHFLGERASNGTSVVLTAMQLIFSGARRCPNDMSSVAAVLTVIHEVVVASDFHN